MAKVNKESLAKVIRQLEEWESDRVLTLKEEFHLEAYRMLLSAIEQIEIIDNWPGAGYYSSAITLDNLDGHELGEAITALAETVGITHE